MTERISDHWAATAANWDGDTPRLQWHATLRRAAALTSLVERLRPHLERTYLEAVDGRWLHLTIHDVGFWPHARGELEQLVQAADEVCRPLPPIAVRLGPPRLMKTAVVLQPSPPDPIWQLRELLRAADVRVRGHRATPLPAGPASPPHVSIAYARDAADAGDLAATLATVAPPEVGIEISAVDLLRLRRDYTWDTITSVELAAG